MILFGPILIDTFQHFKYFVFGSFPQMFIVVQLPAPIAVKLLPSNVLHPKFICEKTPQTFLTIFINITKQQNKSNFQAFISYWETLFSQIGFFTQIEAKGITLLRNGVSLLLQHLSLITRKSEEHRSSKLLDILIFSGVLVISVLCLSEDLSNKQCSNLKWEKGGR